MYSWLYWGKFATPKCSSRHFAVRLRWLDTSSLLEGKFQRVFVVFCDKLPMNIKSVTHSTQSRASRLFTLECKFLLLICLLLHGSHVKLPVCLPVIFSCLGIIPCKGADKQSSSCGDTWTATSTGWRTLLWCWCWVRECDEDVERGEASGEDGGLSRGLSTQRLPWHCLRLCSMKSRMSAKGKREWHWPQVSRSWSPFRGSPWATPRLGESWESSSGKTPESGSAG